MPLALSEVGKEVKIVKRSMLNDNLKRHFDNLGLNIGEKITPISENRGDLIVKVKESRIAINRGLAMKIFVE